MSRITESDLQNLRASGLTDETIREHDLHTGTVKGVGKGLVFPYRDLEGNVNCFARVRLHIPRMDDKGKPVKYAQPQKSGQRAFYAATSLEQLKDGTAPVFVTEGEKKALALAQLGYTAVGIGGIWSGTQKTDAGGHELIPDLAAVRWAGRAVYVVFDWDAKPKTRADSETALRRLVKALKDAGAGDVYAVEIPPGPNQTKMGVDDYIVAAGGETFRELVESAKPADGINGKNADFPAIPGRQLFRLIPPGLRSEAYHGLIGEFIQEVAPHTEATDAGVLAHLLPALGVYAGPSSHVFAGSRQSARVNTVLVGPTSTGRKGTAFAPVDLLMEWVNERFWAAQKSGGLSSGEGLINAVADKKHRNAEGEEEVEVVEKRLYVVEEEFSRVLTQAKREGNILSQVIREAFDNGTLNVLTRGSPLQAKGAHIAITGHITLEELTAKLSGVEMANGFGNRFLWFAVKSDKVIPKTDPIPNELFKRFAGRINSLLRPDEPARSFTLSADAQELWSDELYPTLREDRPGVVGAMTARGQAIVPRLALIYALLDGERKGNEILLPHLLAARAVWDYSAASVNQLFAGELESSLDKKLLALLADGPMKKNQFTDHIALKVSEIDAALGSLVAAGKVRRVKEVKSGAGRPAVVYERVTPEKN